MNLFLFCMIFLLVVQTFAFWCLHKVQKKGVEGHSGCTVIGHILSRSSSSSSSRPAVGACDRAAIGKEEKE